MPPAVSQAQRGFIYATKGKDFAKAHHFDNKGKLPKHKNKKRKGSTRYLMAVQKG